MPFRRWILAAPLTISMAVLTSCASTDELGDLDRERQAADSMPDVVEFPEDMEIVPESSRAVGVYEGAELWLARTADDGVCLLVLANDADWQVGCSGNPPLTVRGAAGSFTVISDGQDPPEDASRISENVFGH